MKKTRFAAALFLVFLFVMGTANYAFAASHNYYGKTITKKQAAEADAVARDIAQKVKSDKSLKTDLDKVARAAQIVSEYAMRGRYGADEKKYYRSPYGVFISGNFTCAGATRALGRVLDFMGYQWKHIGENKWEHQWCVLTMDGKTGFADANVFPGGLVGYGERPDPDSLLIALPNNQVAVIDNKVPSAPKQRSSVVRGGGSGTPQTTRKDRQDSEVNKGGRRIGAPMNSGKEPSASRKKAGLEAEQAYETWYKVCKAANSEMIEVRIMKSGINENIVNLWVFSGEACCVTEDMLKLLNVDQLFCVMAHELGHAELGHNGQRGKIKYSYNRSEETAADKYAAGLAVKAGIPISAFGETARVLRKARVPKSEHGGFCYSIPDDKRIKDFEAAAKKKR